MFINDLFYLPSCSSMVVSWVGDELVQHLLTLMRFYGTVPSIWRRVGDELYNSHLRLMRFYGTFAPVGR